MWVLSVLGLHVIHVSKMGLCLHEIRGYSGNSHSLFRCRPTYFHKSDTCLPMGNELQRRHKSIWLSASGTSCGEKGVVDVILSPVYNHCCRRSYHQTMVPFHRTDVVLMKKQKNAWFSWKLIACLWDVEIPSFWCCSKENSLLERWISTGALVIKYIIAVWHLNLQWSTYRKVNHKWLLQ